MTITAVKILTRAIEIWEEKGWIQGQARDFTGASCASGAIETAAQELDLSYFSLPTQAAIIALMREAGVPIGKSIIDWNDHPSRTKEDVILATKRAIERLETEPHNFPKFGAA